MLKKHQQLAGLLGKAEELAKEIERSGGNTQGVIHLVRQARTLVGLRVAAYEEAEAEAAKQSPCREIAVALVAAYEEAEAEAAKAKPK